MTRWCGLLVIMSWVHGVADAQGTSIEWRELEALPVPAAGGASGVVRGTWVYAGGTTWGGGVKRWLADVFRFDPAARKWSASPALPVPLAYGAWLRTAGSLEVLGGAGEKDVTRKIWKLGNDGWRGNGEAPADTLFGRAAEIGGSVYLFGGCRSQTDLAQCGDHVFVRSAKGEWRRVSTLPQGKIAMPAGAVAGGRMYLFGGCSMGSELVNRDDAWSFDPATANWRKLRPLPAANRGLAAVAIDERTILLAGGYASGFSSSIVLYDVVSDRYTPAGDVPVAAAGIELLMHEGDVIAIGGEPRMKERSARVFRGKLRR